MPIFYFSGTEYGSDFAHNDEGLEFETLGQACRAAERALREIAAHAPLDEKTFRMSVLDERGAVLHTTCLAIATTPC